MGTAAVVFASALGSRSWGSPSMEAYVKRTVATVHSQTKTEARRTMAFAAKGNKVLFRRRIEIIVLGSRMRTFQIARAMRHYLPASTFVSREEIQTRRVPFFM